MSGHSGRAAMIPLRQWDGSRGHPFVEMEITWVLKVAHSSLLIGAANCIFATFSSRLRRLSLARPIPWRRQASDPTSPDSPPLRRFSFSPRLHVHYLR